MTAIELNNSAARIVVRPDLGAGLTAFDVRQGGGWQAILRRVDPATANPFALSNILLVPFSGRVSGGGFSFDGTFHALPRNVEAEKYPLHGNGFSANWDVISQSADAITLSLSSDGPGPFRYEATMYYRLEGASLVMALSVVNRAKIRLPYGAGFHPWFVRDADTTLSAPAGGVWLEQPDHLPKAYEPVASHPDMDFNQPRPLPARWINNWFDGWDGKARIEWPARGLAAEVTASQALRQYVVFSPAADADFFCFEPVTHPVDAFNLPGSAEDHGLKILVPSETLAVETRITVTA
ncbi:aldose 1-epimerase [Shinella sp. CPCC 100929]|uniref:Aldose 1-epimerase n=1 Tax=Shinella lacus TaxID=2654216 RepID=A0ABT1R4C1_9HYPH|nr:aldose 1-epimerase [Shinella lacus]MCQ4630018.1 aldose 1-epimerase [Shinella lacus]